MQKTLIIKTGAAGDVVRTTVLLNALSGPITWVTNQKYAALLPLRHPSLERIISMEEAPHELMNEEFDHTISLEEDLACAALATTIKTKKLTGIYLEGNNVTYTNESAGWFDMSLVSKKGEAIANDLKWNNTQTFQYWLFRMMGATFSGEPYCIYKNRQVKREKGLVGIETRAGDRWPNKSWSGYEVLVNLVEKAGYRCLVLSQKNSITDYLDDIARCSFLVSGDTLAMHVAMAYQVPSIALFNCTSPAEIHDYGTCKKMISPLLQESFYSREYSRAVTGSISPESVYAEFIRQAKLMETPAKV